MEDAILITAKALDSSELLRDLATEEDGAVVTFAGVVRRLEGDRELSSIDYEAYGSMARSALVDILAEAHQRWPRFRARIAHRTGLVEVGEPSVLVVVAAGHRGEAFEVARFLIDELKARVPIWKRDHIYRSHQ